jgi:hypothetical protein
MAGADGTGVLLVQKQEIRRIHALMEQQGNKWQETATLMDPIVTLVNPPLYPQR